jgi:hypothetical protein
MLFLLPLFFAAAAAADYAFAIDADALFRLFRCRYRRAALCAIIAMLFAICDY